MENQYSVIAYSGSEKIAEMKHLSKDEAKHHKKVLKDMCKGQIKKYSIEVVREWQKSKLR